MVKAKGRKKVSSKKEWESHQCYECESCEPVSLFHTLTVHGRRPTLGTCPYWTMSRCVLLSQKACEHFKEKKYDKQGTEYSATGTGM